MERSWRSEEIKEPPREGSLGYPLRGLPLGASLCASWLRVVEKGAGRQVEGRRRQAAGIRGRG